MEVACELPTRGYDESMKCESWLLRNTVHTLILYFPVFLSKNTPYLFAKNEQFEDRVVYAVESGGAGEHINMGNGWMERYMNIRYVVQNGCE